MCGTLLGCVQSSDVAAWSLGGPMGVSFRRVGRGVSHR